LSTRRSLDDGAGTISRKNHDRIQEPEPYPCNVAPGERLIAVQKTPHALMFDVRNYVYDGAVQFVTARLYQGQTTNFRIPGGGFSPVFTETAPESGPVPACPDAPAVEQRQQSESG